MVRCSIALVLLVACGSVKSDDTPDATPECDGVVDCAGVCNGDAVEDCNGVCNGDAVEDCNGVCGGPAAVDGCGVCAPPEAQCKWPDSETRVCHDTKDTVTCPSTPDGQDGDYEINVPVYSANDETVTDPITGLVWERNPNYVQTVKADAIAHCEGLTLAGADDWRLPTRLELTSLADAGRVGPPWPTVFEGIPGNSFFWTSTANPVDNTQTFVINTNFPVYQFRANDSPGGGSGDLLVRCVRGGNLTGNLRAEGQTVVDERTNLIWQSGVAAASMIWVDALATCESLVLDGHDDWRLPNIKELFSIVDDTTSNPAISMLFDQRPSDIFWSSTPAPGFQGAYPVNFTNGLSDGIEAPFSELHQVRCVRNAP